MQCLELSPARRVAPASTAGDTFRLPECSARALRWRAGMGTDLGRGGRRLRRARDTTRDLRPRTGRNFAWSGCARTAGLAPAPAISIASVEGGRGATQPPSVGAWRVGHGPTEVDAASRRCVRGCAPRRKRRMTAERTTNSVNHQPGPKCQGSARSDTLARTLLLRRCGSYPMCCCRAMSAPSPPRSGRS